MKQGNQYVHPQAEITLFSKRIFHKNKSTVECFYCKRRRHTILNCKIHASDLLKGKLKESANITISCKRCRHTILNCKVRASDLLKGKLKESASIPISEQISNVIYEVMPNFYNDCEFNT